MDGEPPPSLYAGVGVSPQQLQSPQLPRAGSGSVSVPPSHPLQQRQPPPTSSPQQRTGPRTGPFAPPPNQPRLTADQERQFVEAIHGMHERGLDERDPPLASVLKFWKDRSLVNSSAVSMETARQAHALHVAEKPMTIPPGALPPTEATSHLYDANGADVREAQPPAAGSVGVLSGGGVNLLSDVTPEQALQLQAQTMAYKYIARGAPIPPAIQLAAAGASTTVPPTVLGLTGEPVRADAVAQQHGEFSRTVAQAAVAAARENGLPPLLQRGQQSRRQIAPRTLPHGMALQQMLQARESRIRLMMSRRAEELSGLYANIPHPLKIRALIELKALRLVDFQRKLREEVVRGMRKTTSTEIRHAKKRHKRQELQEERLSERLERQQQQEKENRERARKLKHREALNRIIQHAKDFKEHHKNVAARSVKLGDFVSKWHRNTLAEEKRARERAEQNRRRALKANDYAAWEDMVMSERNERAVHLVTQTTKFLDDLIGKVLVTKEDAEAESRQDGLPTAPPASLTIGTKPDELPKNRRFYQIAHSIMETITTQPVMLKNGQLKEYQLKGLQWMVSLYNNNLNGILADEMGLGKTIQTIALLAYLMEFKSNKGPFLIVVPLSTMNNWSLEFEKWAPEIVKVVYQGDQKTRRELLKSQQFNALITTYEMIMNDRPFLSKLKWMHLIVDEGHRLKNDASKLTTTLSQYYNAQHRLLLTGTPLQNSLPELWSLLNFLLPKVFNSVTTFDKWFNAPFESYKVASKEDLALKEEEQLYLISRLHSALEPFMLRRLKKDVAAELPEKVEKMIKCRMSALQEIMYKECTANKIGDPDATNHFRFNKNGTLAELRKICNHPFLNNVVNQTLNINDTDLLVRSSGKFELLDRIIPKLLAVKQQVVLFFQMTTCMDYVAQYFEARGFRYLRLDGHASGDERTEAMKLFSAPNPDYYLFIATTRAGGQGINLQTAATVIHFESDWNPHADQQAQARTHRLGQQQEVRIFRFIVDHSIEEMIVERAQHKLNIDEKVIQAGKFDLKTTNDERDLLLKAIMQRQREGENEDGEESPEYDDEELNQMLARTDDDLKIFARIDQERQERLRASWRSQGHKTDPPRLMTIDEVPPSWLEKAIPIEVRQQQEFDSHGRGQRKQSRNVSYIEPSDAQFLKAMEADDPQEYLEKLRLRKEKKQRKLEAKAAKAAAAGTTAVDSPDEVETPPPPPVKRQKTAPASAAKGRQAKAASTVTPKVLSQAMNRLLDHLEAVRDETGRPRCELFMELPSRSDYADYFNVIRRPVSISILRMRISQSRYRTLEAMSVDVHEMINNAKTFNQEGSAVYEDAETLEREFEAALLRTRQELGLLAPPTESASGSGLKVSIKWNAGDGAKGAKAKSRGPARRPVSEENSDESAEDDDQEEDEDGGDEDDDDDDEDGGGNASARRQGGRRRRGVDGGDSSDEEEGEDDDDDDDDDDDGDSNSDEEVAASARRPVSQARGAQGRGAKAVPKPAGRASPSSKRRGAAPRGRGGAPARRARTAASAPSVGRKRGRAEEEEQDDDDDSTSGSEDGSSDAAPANDDDDDDEDGSDDEDDE